MTASPEEEQQGSEETTAPLRLVHAEETQFVYKFRPEHYDEGAVARKIGELTTYASEHHRDFLGGKSGILLEVEHRNKRRALAARIFCEFGMIEGALLSEEELAEVKAAKEQAYRKSKKQIDREANSPTATDVLSDAGRAFVERFYDPAEATAAARPTSATNDLIDAYYEHPVIKTLNSWARLIGTSNEYMRKDAVLLQRASAIMLERIGETQNSSDL